MPNVKSFSLFLCLSLLNQFTQVLPQLWNFAVIKTQFFRVCPSGLSAPLMDHVSWCWCLLFCVRYDLLAAFCSIAGARRHEIFRQSCVAFSGEIFRRPQALLCGSTIFSNGQGKRICYFVSAIVLLIQTFFYFWQILLADNTAMNKKSTVFALADGKFCKLHATYVTFQQQKFSQTYGI